MPEDCLYMNYIVKAYTALDRQATQHITAIFC